MPYDEARDIIRAELLKSVGEFNKWWTFNRPSRIPKNPPRAYKKEWKGWGDFLGHSNPFPMVRRKFRNYKDSRAWANTLNFTTRAQWYEHCKRPDFPDDVPRRPDVYFQQKLEWVSWKNFLGYKVSDKIASIGETDHIILITRHRNNPSNVYDIGLTTLGKDAIQKHQSESGFILIGAFYHDKNSDWHKSISPYMSQYNSSSYIVQNIADILSVLSLNYLRVSW